MGKKAKRKQAAVMNEMQSMTQQQVDYYGGQVADQQSVVDEAMGAYSDFGFSNKSWKIPATSAALPVLKISCNIFLLPALLVPPIS